MWWDEIEWVEAIHKFRRITVGAKLLNHWVNLHILRNREKGRTVSVIWEVPNNEGLFCENLFCVSKQATYNEVFKPNYEKNVKKLVSKTGSIDIRSNI